MDKTIKVEVTNATVEKGFKAVGEGFEAVGKAFKRKEKNAPKTEEQIQKEAELYDYSDHRLEHQEKFSLSLPEESDPSTTGDSFIPIAILIGVVIFIFYIYISYGF